MSELSQANLSMINEKCENEKRVASHLHHGWARLNESLLLEEAVDYCWKEADTGLAALRRLLWVDL